MSKRSSQQQTKHDNKVEQIAQKLKRAGWKVKADIHGYNKPCPIGKNGYIPDIEAKKAGATRIIEVETPETMGTDKKQHESFRKSASHKSRTTFDIEKAT